MAGPALMTRCLLNESCRHILYVILAAHRHLLGQIWISPPRMRKEARIIVISTAATSVEESDGDAHLREMRKKIFSTDNG